MYGNMSRYNIGKLCKRHRLPVSRARKRISPYIYTLCSTFKAASVPRSYFKLKAQEWLAEDAGGVAEGSQVAFDLFLLVFAFEVGVK